MKLTMKTYLPGEAAFLCRLALGDSYDWGTRLADWRRSKGLEYGGPVLLPATTIKEPRKRPVYLFDDVVEFIETYAAYDKSAQRCLKPQARYVEVDTTTGNQTWKVRPSRVAAVRTCRT